MNRLRLGVIGLGLAFRELHLPVLAELRDRFEIVAVCSHNVNRARGVASQIQSLTGSSPSVCASPEQLLSGSLDAVDIAVPISLTATFARQALASGRHVFSEKPLADKLEDAIELIRLARARRLGYMVGENFRYQRQFDQLRELIAAGLVGRARIYRLNDLHYTPPESKYAATTWRREGRHAGGYLIDGGTHIVAGMRILVGSRVAEVHGLSASFNPEILSHQDDALLLNLRFENGLIGQVALGYAAVDHDARRPKVYGTEGTAVLFKDRIEFWSVNDGAPKRVELEPSGTGFLEEWVDFHRLATEGIAPKSTPEDALGDLQVVLAGLESARSGRVVTLPPVAELI